MNTPAASHSSTQAEVWAALDPLTDPEIPVITLREMGILREVRQGGDGVTEVVITPTYSGCPAMGQIEDDVRAALAAAGMPARVVTQLAPAWTTDWMNDAARCASHAPAGGSAVVRFAGRSPSATDVPCPRCGSSSTTEISHFGSTACKAQYRCLDCMEPFDYFKPY